MKRMVALLATAALAAPLAALAAEGPAVPESSIARPPAAARPAAALDEPAGPPAYAPRLARNTPPDLAAEVPPGPVTQFGDALERAYWTSPALIAQRARLRSTDYRLPQARALSGPSLSYRATYGYQRDNIESPFGSWFAQSGWSSTAAAILTQPLLTFGRNAAGERGALAEIAFERAQLRSSEANALFGAIRAYVLLLRAGDALSIVEEDLALLEREYADNTARFAKREVTSSDLQQVETRVELSRAQLFSARDELATARAQFLAAVGAPAGDLAPPDPLPVPVRTLEEVYAFAESHSPVLGGAYARERISRAAADAARAAMLPRVDLRGTGEIGTVSPYSDSRRATALRGEVVVSGLIFDSGLLRARLQEAEAANDADWRLIDQALRENRAEVADAWNEWLAQTAAIDRLRLASDAARRAFEGALLQEKAGLRTTLDVLSLARELLQARSAYTTATASAYLAQARLLAAMGALERSYLTPDAPPGDDPDRHLRQTRSSGEVPLLVPALRAVDRLFVGGRKNRPVRDPAGPLTTDGVPLPVPASGGVEVPAQPD